jgi:hypothetical protein
MMSCLEEDVIEHFFTRAADSLTRLTPARIVEAV